MPAAGGNHPIETPVRRTPLKIGTTTATQRPLVTPLSSHTARVPTGGGKLIMSQPELGRHEVTRARAGRHPGRYGCGPCVWVRFNKSERSEQHQGQTTQITCGACAIGSRNRSPSSRTAAPEQSRTTTATSRLRTTVQKRSRAPRQGRAAIDSPALPHRDREAIQPEQGHPVRSLRPATVALVLPTAPCRPLDGVLTPPKPRRARRTIRR